ncbi:MAG TPA: tetratricopeptide repeat protein [Thermoguttaceae bacterium]|nr:tetratricopeptide repeat protein [Thermoguttaceae bacterium]
MARFDKLEFNTSGRPSAEPAERDPLARDAGYWMNQADASRREGLYESALKYYSRALELDRSVVAGWVGQVQMLVQLGEYPEAELWSRKGLELFPNNGELLAGRAHAFCRMGDMKQAHALSDGSLQQAGESAYRWLVRGEIMMATRQDMDRHCFDKAQAANPDWLVPMEIAQVELYYRRPSKAWTRIRNALETTPDATQLWYMQGLCQAELGMTQAAKESFERCLELSPRHVATEKQLRRMKKRKWSARRLFRRLLGR